MLVPVVAAGQATPPQCLTDPYAVTPPLEPMLSNETTWWSSIERAIEPMLITRRDYSVLHKGGFQSTTKSTYTGVTCNAGSLERVYTITDSNGLCTAGSGTVVQACQCKYDSSVHKLVPYGGPDHIWAHSSSGVDPGLAGLYGWGLTDWQDPWISLYTEDNGACAQEKWVQHLGNKQGYLPVSGHSLITYFRLGLDPTDGSGFPTMKSMVDTIAFVGFVGADQSGVVLNASATSAATAIQNINNGYGVLWFGNQFQTVWKRRIVIGGTPSTESNIDMVYDLTNADARENCGESQRALLHALMSVNFVRPGSLTDPGDSPKSMAFRTGFFPLGNQDNFGDPGSSPWVKAYGGPTSEFDGTPSGAGVDGHLRPIVAMCRKTTPTAGSAYSWFLVGNIHQTIVEHGN